MPTRLTSATTALLVCLVQDFPVVEGTWGRNLASATGLASGTVYPMLKRLEREGLVESVEEQIDPAIEGRPRRTYWRLTPDGAVYARSVRAEQDARRRAAKSAARPSRRLWPAGGAS